MHLFAPKATSLSQTTVCLRRSSNRNSKALATYGVVKDGLGWILPGKGAFRTMLIPMEDREPTVGKGSTAGFLIEIGIRAAHATNLSCLAAGILSELPGPVVNGKPFNTLEVVGVICNEL